MEEQHMLGWNIPPEHADLVHIHWRNYPAPDNIWHFIMAGVYFTLMLLSTSGNGIVIYLFMTWVLNLFQANDLEVFKKNGDLENFIGIQGIMINLNVSYYIFN